MTDCECGLLIRAKAGGAQELSYPFGFEKIPLRLDSATGVVSLYRVKLPLCCGTSSRQAAPIRRG